MKIRFNVRGYIDRRNEQLHAQHDVLVEQEWRRRVAANPKERARLDRERRVHDQSLFVLPVANVQASALFSRSPK